MKIKFWGTRGSIPVPGKDTIIYGGNTTCLEVTLESGTKVILDAGTGIRALGERLLADTEKLDIYLLMTHIHWDHVLGFPFFRPIYEPGTKILVDGFPTCMQGLRYAFNEKPGKGLFPVGFNELKAEISYLNKLNRGPLKIDNVVIDSILLQHPQGGVGFRFREEKKTFVFLTDNELTRESWADRHPEDFVGFCKDADVLVHDAQYTSEEKERLKGWGHSACADALSLALQADVKRLILFHHDPSRKDPDVAFLRSQCEDLARKNNSGIRINAAKEGSEISL
ncbi:MAG: MBL fold metallo-hydrolase [Thermodesulfobacteriota bacterium]|nr:MBL fold metallo-hydrolase [Thermodesulfobacteriota bacterium]